MRSPGYLGKRVVLPCNLMQTGDMKVSQVTWVKEVGGRRQNVAVHHPLHGENYPLEKNSRRIRFAVGESLADATLIIEHLLMTDEGTYSCEFATYPDGNAGRHTNLIVLAKPTSAAEAIEVKSSNVEQPVAVCTSSNGKPPARVTWQSKLSGNSSVKHTNNSDGTITVQSHYHLVPAKEANEQQITCLVEHVALPQTESYPVRLSIMYAPEVTIEGYDDNWYLTRSDATLVCSARGNPTPVDFFWTTSSGSLPKSVEVEGHRLLVKKVDYSVNTTFICQATNRVGRVSTQQNVFVREKPNQVGAATTGGIIGGLIATIVALAVVATGILICRQQQKNRMDPELDDLEGPPAYKPPPPCQLSEETDPDANASGAESLPFKAPYYEPNASDNLFGGVAPTMKEEVPRYHELPTLEEREAAAEAGPSLEDEYLDQMNPIYDGLSFATTEDDVALTSLPTDKAFVMSRAMYV
ncbi:nectin-2 isoform X1 [Erythrolamprus reginae]|uniref:nectin-2 isoform X1 n=1 Tax=Erythrolamprus reginae TaxID=121349 RepID=UPI00396C82B1